MPRVLVRMPNAPNDRLKGWLGRCLVTDDRGRGGELLDPFGLYLTGREDVIERAVLKRIIDDGSPGGLWKLRLTPLFALGLLVAMVLFAFVPEYRATENLGHSAGQIVRAPVVYWALGYGLLIVPWTFRAERRIRRRRLAAAMLRHGRCAHCGYDLQGLEADADDGATMCPECAAAWKLDAESVAARAGDEHQPQREMVRFHIMLGVLLTIVGLAMAVWYVWR
jgi:hypothetical protein